MIWLFYFVNEWWSRPDKLSYIRPGKPGGRWFWFESWASDSLRCIRPGGPRASNRLRCSGPGGPGGPRTSKTDRCIRPSEGPLCCIQSEWPGGPRAMTEVINMTTSIYLIAMVVVASCKILKKKTGFMKSPNYTYEELISKTSYIHSYMLLICSSGHSIKAHFQHKIYSNGQCWY